MKKIKKILAANRSEIAIRIFRASEESDIKTVAIYSKEDRFALHRFKTDEMVLIPADSAIFFASILFPKIFKICSLGPINSISFSKQAFANSGFSDKKPYPG